MKQIVHALKSCLNTGFLLISFLFFHLRSAAQNIDENLLSCNTTTPYVTNGTLTATVVTGSISLGNPWTGNYGIVVGGVTNTGNIVDNNPATVGTMSYLAAALGGLRTTIQLGNGIIPAGYKAGVVIKNTSLLSLSVFEAFTVKTYLGTVEQESASVGNGLLSVGLINTNGLNTISLHTTKPFNRIMIEQNTDLGITLAATEIHHVFIEKFCAEAVLPASLPCNELIRWQAPAYPVFVNQAHSGVNVTGACVNCGISDADNLVDNNANNYASVNILASLAATASLSVKNAKTIYPAGMFAGFEIDLQRTLSVTVGTYYTIATYLNNVKQDEVSYNGSLVSGGVFTTGGKFVSGFKTSKDFDEIRFTLNNAVAAGTNPVHVYGAVVKRFCAGDALVCNTPVSLTEDRYPVYVDGRHTGINAVACVNCNIIGANNAIDNNPANYTEVVLPVGAATTAAYAVSNGSTIYNTNPATPVFAGFDIESPTLLGVNALNGLSIVTLLNGEIQQTANAGSGLLSAQTSLINGFGRQTVGFIPTQPFDGVKILFDGTVNVNLGTTRIYGMVLKEFCAAEPPCNELKPFQNPDLPVYVNGLRTGIDVLACVGCQINNAENIINGTTSQPASIILAAAVGAKASISVADAIGSYPVGSFAGFDIESATLLSADIIGQLTIDLYNNGSRVYSGAASSLLVGAGASLLTGGPNRQIVGIISPVVFDEIQLNIENIIGANLGTILIYKAYIQKTCARVVDCSTNGLLNSTAHGAVINAAETGVRGGICAACTVQGPWDAVSATTTDYARLYNTVTGIATNSLSVAAPAYTFPAGTFAGFQIRKNNFIIAAGLFPYLTITTFNDGVVQESRSGSGLLDLAVLVQLLGTGNAVYIPGFYTTKPFDEVKISVGSLVTALDQYVDVYGAYVDVRTYTVGGSFTCNISQPDINAGLLNQAISGNLATNDKILAGTTYGGTIAVPAGVTNPSAALPVVQANGAYTFTGTTPGIYQFYVSVCPPATTDNCKLELLTITVQDTAVATTNLLVVNTDIAVTSYNTQVAIASLANDWPGNNGYLLQPTGMQITDLNGATAGNTSAGGVAVLNTTTGNITYTPPTNFVGVDTIRYTVCNNAPVPECGWAYQVIRVLPPAAGGVIIAADDFTSTNVNQVLHKSAVNGVLHNDTYSAGTAIQAQAIDTTITGAGRLILSADGSYQFTPVPGYVGTVAIPYHVSDNNNPPINASATLYILVRYSPLLSLPDVNVTAINRPIDGNVSTNDNGGSNSLTYGTPQGATTNPTGATITMAGNGTYTFSAGQPGIYYYYVPVCPNGQITDCPTEMVTITVNDFTPGVSNNPITYTDIAATNSGNPVTINVLANDRVGTPGFALVKTGVTITDLNGGQSGNTVYGGTATADPVTGNITYTPAPGFIGRDTLQYTVCDNQPTPKCATTFAVIDVYPDNMYNTAVASDDLASIGKGVKLTVTAANGLLINDIDPDGNTLTVTVLDTVIAGKGRVQIAANGSYIYTPEPGFSGTITVPYTIKDNGSPIATAHATLYILVREVPDITPILTLTPNEIVGTTNLNVRIQVNEVNNVATNGLITVYLSKHKNITLNFNPADILVDGVPVQNSKWTFDATTHPGYYILQTTETIVGNGNRTIGLTGVFTPGQTTGRINITTTIIALSGKEENSANNSMALPIIYTHN
jgi:hypothetical protein